ncbi:unnamed protein product [Linum trigynum]|uniref:Uncharacterized protein n=1 Tax=Linum trigynum TaxID=586398 RepID=A0AAV2G875_9ROSI
MSSSSSMLASSSNPYITFHPFIQTQIGGKTPCKVVERVILLLCPHNLVFKFGIGMGKGVKFVNETLLVILTSGALKDEIVLLNMVFNPLFNVLLFKC